MISTTLSARDSIPLAGGADRAALRKPLSVAAVVVSVDLSLLYHVPSLACVVATAVVVAFCSRRLEALDALDAAKAPPSETR